MKAKYIPRAIDKNVNVSKVHPLKSLLKMLAGAVVVVVVIYLILGAFVDLLSPHIPVGVEKKLGELFVSHYGQEQLTEENDRLQQMLGEMVPHLSADDRRFDYRVMVLERPEVNALALPGGHIAVFKGLLDEVESEGEIRFVLAHELGHFHGRHHLSGLGRTLITITMSMLLFGGDSVATDFLFKTIQNVEMKFSQQQEIDADLFALRTLSKVTGDCGGAERFMQRLVDQNERSRLTYYFASHPHPEIRRAKLGRVRENLPTCALK